MQSLPDFRCRSSEPPTVETYWSAVTMLVRLPVPDAVESEEALWSITAFDGLAGLKHAVLPPVVPPMSVTRQFLATSGVVSLSSTDSPALLPLPLLLQPWIVRWCTRP